MPSSPPDVPAALVDVLPTLSRAAGSANQYCRIPLPFQSPILSLPNDRAGGVAAEQSVEHLVFFSSRAALKEARARVEESKRRGRGGWGRGAGFAPTRGTRLYRRPVLGLPATAWRLALALALRAAILRIIMLCVSSDRYSEWQKLKCLPTRIIQGHFEIFIQLLIMA